MIVERQKSDGQIKILAADGVGWRSQVEVQARRGGGW